MRVINLKLFVTSLFFWAVTAVTAQNIHYAKPDMDTKALLALQKILVQFQCKVLTDN